MLNDEDDYCYDDDYDYDDDYEIMIVIDCWSIVSSLLRFDNLLLITKQLSLIALRSNEMNTSSSNLILQNLILYLWYESPSKIFWESIIPWSFLIYAW